MRLTEDEFQMYLFTRKYTGWASFTSDSRTLKAARGLAAKGLIQINQYGQLRGTQPDGQPL